jgi:beta-aspartyl-dipeptidase (metallo-type)
VPLCDAVKPLTENVARALGLYPRKGALLEGSDADLLLLDDELRIRAVFAGGEAMMTDGVVRKKWQWAEN